MYLYIDETECHEYFIVTGLMVNSKQEIETAYKRFKKKAESIRISANMKAILFSEFKSTLLDKHYQKAKKELLLQLNEFEYKVFYSCFEKKNIDFRQGVKEKTYIRLLSLIISSIKCNVNVCFDRFNKKDFENKIIAALLSFNNVSSAEATDSQKEPGIKYVDNLCSVIRLMKTNQDDNHFYEDIKNQTNEV